MNIAKTVTVDYYKLADLSGKAAERAYRIWLQSDPVDSRPIVDALIQQARILGITIDRFYYTGFYGQGDGACFDGNYAYNPRWREAYKYNGELGLIGQRLHDMQAGDGFNITANIQHNGCRYYHANSIDIDVSGVIADSAIEIVENRIKRFMYYCYDALQLDHDSSTSFEAFEAAADADGRVFAIDGKDFDYI